MNWNEIPDRRQKPDFKNLLKVLRREVPDRPTLFEFYMNERIYSRVVPEMNPTDQTSWFERFIQTFFRLGYDFATVLLPGFRFTDPDHMETKESFSLNACGVIADRNDFDRFEWPGPETADYELLNRLTPLLPKGMKLIPYTPDGILENVIRLMGLDVLCYTLIDDSQLVSDIFEQVGSRLLEYYKHVVQFDCVGACIANDDWGFKTSTFLSPDQFRRYVFPWYRRINEVVHNAGKPVILHSCGYFDQIIDDIIDDLGFDGRHSYEDAIVPVETAYEEYHERIAILGGIDVEFMCHNPPADVYQRSREMLARTSSRGAYALGTGNSVPEYLPDESYFAMIRAALDAV